MRVGLDAAPLRLPLTGVGSYALYLLEAVLRRPDAPEMTGFDLAWREWTSALARQQIARSAEFDGESPRNSWRALLRPLKNSPAVGQVYSAARASAFRRSLKAQNLSLFHAFAYAPPGATSCPAIPVVYDVSFVRFPHFHPRRRVEALKNLGIALERAPLVHTISEFSAAEITDVFGVPRQRIRVIAPGVKPVFWQNNDHVGETEQSAPHRYLLVVSTLEPRKNLKTVIDAFERLPVAIRTHCPLLVAGTPGWGDGAGDSGRIASLQREGSLRFLGFVSDARLRQLYAGCTAMLYPSIYEGFGMPVIEALAAGARVISADGTALPEAGGAVVPRLEALDVAAWTAAMQQVMDMPDEEDRRVERRRHAQKFSWETAAERAMAMYRDALQA